jgi:hypothetical protein
MDMGNQQVQVSDLGLAAALTTLGFKIEKQQKNDSGRVSFCFLESGSLTSTINNYWANKLSVDARAYFDNTKALKNLIYSGYPR